MIAHACNPSVWETEAGGSCFVSQLRLQTPVSKHKTKQKGTQMCAQLFVTHAYNPGWKAIKSIFVLF